MRIRFQALVLFAFTALLSGCATRQQISIPPKDRLLILVSIDGFRWDYLEKFKKETPHLNELASNGVHATKLISAFPSLTFPNHYTLVTGLWPEHHGIVNNKMYDPAFKTNFNISHNPGPREGRWWGGEPIWVTAIKQGRDADCMFWPGSEAAIQGVRPTKWKTFDSRLTPEECVATGLGWLASTNKRPAFLSLYFHDVDTESHHRGINAPETADAVADVDTAIGKLMDGIHRLSLDAIANVIIVSDHGMVEVSTNRLIVLSDYVDLKTVQVDSTGAIGGLRPLGGDIDALYNKFKARENHFKVYRKETMPERYHYTASPRIPPVVLVADEGWYITGRAMEPDRHFEYATHGFDPELSSMGATFIAYGPAFHRHLTIPPSQNVNVYELMCDTLGLKAARNDGNHTLAKEVLVP